MTAGFIVVSGLAGCSDNSDQSGAGTGGNSADSTAGATSNGTSPAPKGSNGASTAGGVAGEGSKQHRWRSPYRWLQPEAFGGLHDYAPFLMDAAIHIPQTITCQLP